MPESEEKPNQGAPWLKYAGVGVEFAGAVAALTVLGWWLDNRWQTTPWIMLAGMFVGIIGGTYNLIRESLKAFKESGKPSRSAKPPRDDS